ncbi:hypothetical protein GCM10010435_14220 [Winogradskya consettensis]|uniref:Pyrrolo-quinoline quinone repeat domain-containing protein n=1 Tax=Winogradskya consettensis TaxID=113560 RepID=A0A919VML2_9ACTN|nr:PQQ-binding-like beta-propeller repeat protein [Actinoplanes consettensis]GIM69048.1 hypothetical protein Aco04nite_13490 [Actinoplanes consettensis]
MAVIELGLVTGDDEEPRAPARRRVRPGDIRILAAVVAVLCVVAVTGSEPPESHAPVTLWSVPLQGGSDSFASEGSNVYVLSSGEGYGAQRSLTAYDLRNGTARWSVQGVDDATWIGSVTDGVLTLPAAGTTVEYENSDGSKGLREYTRDTIALDTATGQELWRLRGEFFSSGGGRVLLGEWNSEGSTVSSLRVVGLRDGVTAWRRTGSGAQSWVTTNGVLSDRLVTATAEGLVEVLDFADGHVVATQRLPWQPAADSSEQTTELSVEEHTLYLRTVDGDRGRVVAYDTETLRELWRLDSRPFGGFYACGPVMCLNDDNGISGYDPVTGQLRWQRPGGGYAFPLYDDRLVVDEDQDGSRHSVIDGRTGATLTDLGTATLVWSYTDGSDQVYALTRTTQPPGATAVSALDKRTGTLAMRGLIPQVQDYGCQAAEKLLVCATNNAQLSVTDLAF